MSKEHIIEGTPAIERRVNAERRMEPRERIARLERELAAMKAQRTTEAAFCLIARERLTGGMYADFVAAARLLAAGGK
jgi:hypothetical protein